MLPALKKSPRWFLHRFMLQEHKVVAWCGGRICVFNLSGMALSRDSRPPDESWRLQLGTQ